ncbi:PP2C family protein-serine/threonine phosphatase [Deltaproteobacteria bacterium TL4]
MLNLSMAKEIKEIKESLEDLSKWLKDIENYSLAKLKSAPIFMTEHSCVNILAHEIHLLRVNAKKKEEKLRFLSDFFESFNTVKGSEEIIKDVFRLLNRYLDNSDAVMFSKDKESNRFIPVEESFTDFLNLPLDEQILPIIFPDQNNEISTFNNINHETPIFDFYYQEDALFLEGGHMMFIRLKGFDHIMCFLRIGSEEFFDFDVEFVQGIADKIRTLISNLSQIQREIRMAEELKTAAAVQQSLFPKSLPDFEHLKFSSYFKSASETGGDWYGFMQIQNTLYVLIGDVTGHGTPAALVTAAASATCAMVQKMYLLEQKIIAPSEVLSHLNHIVKEAGSSTYLMTFFVGAIELTTGKVAFSNAGHNFPYLLRNAQISYLLNSNMRLGDRENLEFTESSMQLEDNDLLFFYTDGLIECENREGEMMGEKRLKRWLCEFHKMNVPSLVGKVVEQSLAFYNNQPAADDITIVALRWKT